MVGIANLICSAEAEGYDDQIWYANQTQHLTFDPSGLIVDASTLLRYFGNANHVIKSLLYTFPEHSFTLNSLYMAFLTNHFVFGYT
jgi:hypothetical protein